jgi:DNA replicative helicase MCM subunit Mcm2 (Cdc46/Mcm family)
MMCRLRIDGDRKMLPKGLNVCEGSNPGAITRVYGYFTVSSTWPVMMRLLVGRFECKVCGATQDVEQSLVRDWMKKPLACNEPGCNNKKQFRLLDKQSTFDQEQRVRLLLNAEDVQDNDAQVEYEVSLDGENAKLELHAGDRVFITGIFDELNHYFVEVMEISKEDAKMKISKDDTDRIKELAKRPDVIDILTRSLAPDVFGLDEVKKAVILAMFKGIKLKNSINRADIHIAIIGDPGTAKTRLAFAIMARVPLSAFASGERITASGLTGTIEQVKIGGQLAGWRSTIGKVQMAANGLLILDEFDKSDPAVSSVLNQVMETGRLLSNKASVHVDSYCPEGIVMLANPKFKVWSDDLTFLENVRFKPYFLSRFDLVFVVRTPEDSKINYGIAKTKLYQYLSEDDKIMEDQATLEEIIPPILFKKWIHFANETVGEFYIMDDAKQMIEAEFLKYTSAKNDKDECWPKTTRILDQIMRLASARAKISLRGLVTVSDVKFALAEIDASLKSFAI